MSNWTAMVTFEDPGQNSFKFWRYFAIDGVGVVCNWGRIGSLGQFKFFPGESVQQAEAKLTEKLGKGYTYSANGRCHTFVLSRSELQQISSGNYGPLPAVYLPDSAEPDDADLDAVHAKLLAMRARLATSGEVVPEAAPADSMAAKLAAALKKAGAA
jgi:predicted DNA-binding WGR domain protein